MAIMTMKQAAARAVEYGSVALAGGAVYGILEVVWRGWTHPSMLITGGACALGLYLLQKRCAKRRLHVRCFMGAAMITAVELLVGCLVNRVLRLGVWDYSYMPYNLLGQICPLYSAIWFLLCVPAFSLCRRVREAVFA